MRKLPYAILVPLLFVYVPVTHAGAEALAVDKSTLAPLLPNASDGDLSSFIASGRLEHRYGQQIETLLAPSFSWLSEMRRNLSSVRPDLGIEMLYGATIPQQILEGKSMQLTVMNVLRSVSSLSGLTYQPNGSARKTLYDSAYAIAGPENRTRVPDPISGSIPEHQTVYVLEKDTTFGEYVMEVDYHVSTLRTGGSSNLTVFCMAMQNRTPLHFLGIVPVVGPGELRMDLVVVPVGNCLLLYGNADAKVFSPFVSRDRLYDMFTSRIDALHAWLVEELRSVATH